VATKGRPGPWASHAPNPLKIELDPIVDVVISSNDMTDLECKEPQGKFIPIVDFSRCEAKGPCTQVCPYDVFEIRTIEPSDYAKLGLLSKLKNQIRGAKVSYTPRADRCQACGLCIKACPEQAIKLIRSDW
jgi:NAD-dependent dihydropyrimidine dehydrogenase PreA subunit